MSTERHLGRATVDALGAVPLRMLAGIEVRVERPARGGVGAVP
jgi:hypothetical protein